MNSSRKLSLIECVMICRQAKRYFVLWFHPYIIHLKKQGPSYKLGPCFFLLSDCVEYALIWRISPGIRWGFARYIS